MNTGLGISVSIKKQRTEKKQKKPYTTRTWKGYITKFRKSEIIQ